MMVFRRAFFISLLALFPVTAHAGDVAKLDIIGFSPDGSTFAYEEYGVQDGSGFPYSNRYYVDTATDTFLPKTPVRIRLNDENSSLEDARDEASRQAQGITALMDEDLRANAGETVASNPVTELSSIR
jgi:predicted secreted protein